MSMYIAPCLKVVDLQTENIVMASAALDLVDGKLLSVPANVMIFKFND